MHLVSEAPLSALTGDQNRVVVDLMDVRFQSESIINFRKTGEPAGNSGFIVNQLGHGTIYYEASEIPRLEREFGMPLAGINRLLTQAAEGRFESLTIRSI